MKGLQGGGSLGAVLAQQSRDQEEVLSDSRATELEVLSGGAGKGEERNRLKTEGVRVQGLRKCSENE